MAPPEWNNSNYSTATLQLTVTNTTAADYTAMTQTALLNGIHDYLAANGFSTFYMGVTSVSVSHASQWLL